MIYRFGDFELDEALFELRRQGKPVTVQRRVLELIVFLVRHRDRLVSREDLGAGPWAGTAVSDSALAQALRQARQAFGDDGDDQRVIRTVRGKGVRFVAEMTEEPECAQPGRSSRPAPASLAPSPVFVGRLHELASLRAALEGARAGAGRVVVIEGEAGIGKTALAEQAAREASAGGAKVFWGRGWEAGGTPAFWPWLEALRSLVESAAFRDLGAPPEGATRWLELAPEARTRVLMADLASEEPRVDAQHARFLIFDSITRFLRWVAGSMDVLLVLEDLHAADGDSIALLRFLAPRVRESRLLVVGTLRPEEGRALELGERPEIERFALGALNVQEVEELANATARKPLGAEEVAQIHELSSGNPFVLRELAAARPRFGEDEPGLGVWSTTLERRIASLPADAASVLEIAAVAGRDFDLPYIARVSELEPREALAQLSPAIERRIVRPLRSRPGAYQFSHVLFRDAVDGRLTAERRCDLHARCAMALERDGAVGDDDTYRVAHHYWLASTLYYPDRAREWALKAAERARRAYAYDVESEHLARALRLGELVGTGVSEQLDRLLQLGEAQRYAGKDAAAILTFEKAASMSRASGDALRFADSTIGRFDVVGEAAPADLALQLQLAEALKILKEETPQRAILLAAFAFSRFLDPSADSRKTWDEALRVARGCTNPVALARVVAVGTHFAADPYELLSLATELVALAQGANRSDLLLHGHLFRWLTLLALGQVVECRAAADEHRRLAELLKHPRHSSCAEMMSAVFDVLLGDFEGAVDRARRTRRSGELAGDFIVWPQTGCVLLSIVRITGSSDTATSLFPELRATATKTLEVVPAFLPWRLVTISIEHELGRTEDAAREFRRIVEMGLDVVNHDLNGAAMLGELARLAVLLGEGGRRYAEDLYARLLPLAGTHMVTMFGYLGPVHSTLATLAGALGDEPARMGHLERALADVESIGARPWIQKVERELLCAGPDRGFGLFGHDASADDGKRQHS